MIEKCFVCYVTVVFRKERRGCVVEWLIPDLTGSDSEHPSVHCWFYQWRTVKSTDRTFPQAGWLGLPNSELGPQGEYMKERGRRKEWFICPVNQPNPHSLFVNLSTQPKIINPSLSACLSSAPHVATEQPCPRSLVTSHYRDSCTNGAPKGNILTFGIDFPTMAEISLIKCFP